MCGIGGAVFLTLEDPTRVGHSMTDALHHRGPDARGVRALERAGGQPAGVFAHTRLRIIDLSERAAQPYVSDNGRVSLVFNGEIYEFRRLRARLEREGVRFRSESDTEVVLAQYLRHGLSGLEALDGMFALALWDADRERLVLMRDRVGKKPLYWAEHRGGLIFASEAKALRCVPGFDLDLDPDRIPEYLTFGYVSTPQSIFRGVRRLPAGHRLLRVGSAPPQVEPYWDLLTRTQSPLSVDANEAKGLVRDAVGRAVERRLVADVPVGAFLSGGVDSSVVVAEMAARSSGEVRTFAVGFDDDATYDETRYARAVAAQFGTRHVELRLKPRAEDLFDQLLWHHDEPYGDSSALAVHAISAATREHVTVVLTGDGGDEIFAGYTRFQGGVVRAWLPGWAGRGLSEMLSHVPEPRGYKHPVALARRFVEHSARAPDEQLLAWNAYFAGPALSRLLRSDVYSDFDPWTTMSGQMRILAAARAAGKDRLGQILAHNFATYLLDDLLVKTDRMTMSVGLEARSPFLDADLVELAFRLPSALKLRRGSLKWILREAYRGVLGPDVLDRRKHGFGVPVARWWSGPLRSLVEEVLGPSAGIHDYLNRAEVERILNEHRSGRRDHGQRIFALLQLELFLRARGARAEAPAGAA